MSPQPDWGGSLRRLRTTVRGAVQGVGFRPFVFRLAQELGLNGWVQNSTGGVFVEVEGEESGLREFQQRLELEKPPRSFIQSLEATWLEAVGYRDFTIRASDDTGQKMALVMPDIATCGDCLAEVFDPQNRRYLYPFTNCTNCGPRFSIIEALPYDRANTSMKSFTMCPQCQAEYDNPGDRRFHAQPNACPVCGPRIELWDAMGKLLGGTLGGMPKEGPSQAMLPGVRDAKGCDPGEEPGGGGTLSAAAEAIRSGRIVAVKGLGGFHLMVRADSEEAVSKLRERKHREEKPFAVMFRSIEAVYHVCEVSRSEERLLRSSEAPIVLLPRRSMPAVPAVSAAVAPGNPNLGVLLPYTPLHHLLLARLEFPLVATSGNLSDEPICLDGREASERLEGIADLFLVHNRPIVRHVDDSIVRVMVDRELVLRRARGFAPLPVQLRSLDCGVRGGGVAQQSEERFAPGTSRSPFETVLAVGAHLKNAIALGVGPQVFISQHIGDLETTQAYEAFRRVSADLQRLYDSPAAVVAADMHPDYLSTRFAEQAGIPCTKVQHHVAHVLSCMAENELEPPVLGVAWDGTGYGTDGTVWGGEFFRVTQDGYDRVAHFRPFRLPGGEKAVREPRRCALGLLFEALGENAFERTDLAPLRTAPPGQRTSLRVMLARKLNSPLTSSVGRLFDAVASLMDLRQRVHFEGQAAMELEFLLGAKPEAGAYEFSLEASASGVRIDWRPFVDALLADLSAGVAPSVVSARFHNLLVESVVAVAQRLGLPRVVLSGGCFQNRYLTEQTVERLRGSGFRPYWHQRVPPNDGGICLGQVVAARWWKV